jgi:hypothetical protein
VGFSFESVDATDYDDLRPTYAPAAVGWVAERGRLQATVHGSPSARLADLYATSSDVASLPPASRRTLLARIREISRGLPEGLELPARSVVDLCFRT